ncbi:hypothetical protein FD02_GL000003 [Lacticaseibacillus nasuensis JCM 17158]|uniref:Uncharacterized protein n=1 Tax=Lacticaseibacillus nasuensis JCM 17158 TaxID=1291734 RepID=A0A0R1JI11_9LACO|nr:hypothetical protein FD02_GL000003 [Lacticaseibacillus nasuensis JCM 17158]
MLCDHLTASAVLRFSRNPVSKKWSSQYSTFPPLPWLGQRKDPACQAHSQIKWLERFPIP